jgi:hypothetical protein
MGDDRGPDDRLGASGTAMNDSAVTIA